MDSKPTSEEGVPGGLSLEDVRHIATLCRIGFTEEELERLRAELSSLVREVNVLQAIDTTGVEPTGHLVEGVHTVMRPDDPGPALSIEETLANAPRREGEYFRIRGVQAGME